MIKPVFNKIDCYSIPVNDLDKGIQFYNNLGHKLLQRDGNHSAGLSLPGSDDELVLHTDNRPFETCLLVDSVDTAIESIVKNGGTLVFGPIQIKVGKYALLNDPWKIHYQYWTFQMAYSKLIQRETLLVTYRIK